MNINLEINDLKTTIDGLNNAIIAYSDIRRAIWLMGGVPEGMNPKWNKVINKEANSFDDLVSKFDERIKALKEIYNQLIKME